MAVARLARLPSAELMPTARVSAVFDLDRTLLPGSSLAIFGGLLSDAGLVRRRDVARHSIRESLFAARGLGTMSLERLCRRLVAHAAGHARADVLEVATRAARVVDGRMFPAARWMLREHIGRGDRVVLLSAGPQELVGAIAAVVGADVGLCTEAEVVDGRYTGALAGPFCHGAGKVARLGEALDASEIAACTAYGDSYSDLPVLRAARQAVAVNPDRALAAAAVAAGWPVVRFQ